MANLRNYEKGEGKDWNVKESIAYGRGAVHEDFKGLQQDLNLFAGRVGFEKIDVDGFLGPKTVEIWNAVYQTALKINPTATITFPMITTKEQLAELAQHVRAWLQSTGRKVLLPETQA